MFSIFSSFNTITFSILNLQFIPVHTIIESITNIYHYHQIHHRSRSCCSHLYHDHYSNTMDCILLLQMNWLHVYIIIFICIKSIESSSSNDILLLYIVLHTNPIQCIWIQHLIWYHQKQQQQQYVYKREENKYDYISNYYKEEEENEYDYI